MVCFSWGYLDSFSVTLVVPLLFWELKSCCTSIHLIFARGVYWPSISFFISFYIYDCSGYCLCLLLTVISHFKTLLHINVCIRKICMCSSWRIKNLLEFNILKTFRDTVFCNTKYIFLPGLTLHVQLKLDWWDLVLKFNSSELTSGTHMHLSTFVHTKRTGLLKIDWLCWLDIPSLSRL